MLVVIYNTNMNIIYKIISIVYKIINIIFAIFFTGIIISILFNTEYFSIDDTVGFRILSIIALISMWLPVFVRTNIFIISICIFIFIIYFVLYISHPLL